MKGHRFEKTTPKPQKKSTKSKPNSYEDESFSDYDDYSPRLDNVYVLPPPKGFVVKVDSSEDKDVPESSGSEDILKTPDGEGVFDRFQNQYRPVEVSTEKVAVSSARRSTVIVRLYPDGSPAVRLPQDDDLRQYQLQRVRVPRLV